MHRRYFAPVAGLAVALILGPGRVSAQPKPLRAETKTARPWIPPRTADGHPDLQGVWANNTATPLERPKELAGRAFLTEAEVAALKKKAAELFDGNGDAEFGDGIFSAVLASVKESEKSPDKGPYKKNAEGFDGKTGDYSSVWLVARDWDNRTSLITDPPDGRLPAMTPEGQKRQAASMAKMVAIPGGPEDRGLSERCITFGSPRLSAGYNSYYQIVQSRDTVAIVMETIHDSRIIPINGGPHLPPTVQTWLGDSRGHWDGDTLVVDTTNYIPGSFNPASSEKLHVVERFNRTGPETIKYEVTVDDPATWTKPWTVMIPLRHSPDAIYEYACHEGNRGMLGILKGARAEEKAAEK
jgi:hypothetical protein